MSTGDALEGQVVPAGGRDVAAAPRRSYLTQAEADRVVDYPEETLQLIRGALAENTWAAYKHQWQRYLKWCQESKRTPVPATLETLLSYLASMKREHDGRGLSVSTIRIAMAALKRFHSYGNPPPEWPGGHQAIGDWIAGYAKERARDPDKAPKRAAGARKMILRALIDHLPLTRPSGIRDRAILLLGYYMAARRSELAHLREADLRWTVDGLEVYIAYSKTDQAGEGAWVAVPANDESPPYCAHRAVQAWLDLRAAHHLEGGYLFVAINRYDKLAKVAHAMSGSAFEVVMSRAVDAAFAAAKARKDRKMMALLDPAKVRLSPHSVRRGFATDARAADWDLLDISRHGRWSAQSRVVHVYIEEADRWSRHTRKPVQL